MQIDFSIYYLYNKTYKIVKAFLIKKYVKLIEKKEFVAANFDLDDITFIVYIAFISQNIDIHLFWVVYIAFFKR